MQKHNFCLWPHSLSSQDLRNWRIDNSEFFIEFAGEQGFEPQLPGPEPGVLPLDDSPILVEKQADKFTRSIGPSQKEIPPNWPPNA